MKIAVLGSGTVGTTLAKGFRDAGHEVRIGSRDGEAELFRADMLAFWRRTPTCTSPQLPSSRPSTRAALLTL